MPWLGRPALGGCRTRRRHSGMHRAAEGETLFWAIQGASKVL